MTWDKYGSPYDPNHRGKMQKPQEKRAQERQEQESAQVRGCGDPNCTFCNPDLAGRGMGPVTTPGLVRRSLPSSIFIEFNPSTEFTRPGADKFRDFQNELAARMAASLEAVFSVSDSAARSDKPKLAEPPKSYTDARAEVEKWLCTAPDQAFDDIVGNADALGQLREAIEAPVKHKDLYAAYGMKMPKGAMLSGPPGCGKTMFARAAAAEMKRLYATDKGFEFISISGSELQSPFVGVTEGHIKSIFTFAREYRAFHGHPLLVFMDEADVLLPDRTGRVRRVASWEESQVATFLAEMDGMQESGAFVLLATNRPGVIDQAVLRDGRCDFKITVRRPDAAAIEAILRKNFAGILVGIDTVEQLVFAAVESLFDPHKVIADLQSLGIRLSSAGVDVKDGGHKHFLLEHIVSGAMAASVPARAKRYAFTRDKADGVARGVTVADVVRAVNDLFEENRKLDHSFALEEFKSQFAAELFADQAETAPPPRKLHLLRVSHERPR